MARKTHLRPINETRGPHGQFTSETARRLLARRGALKTNQIMAALGFPNLAKGRETSLRIRQAKAVLTKQSRSLRRRLARQCQHCSCHQQPTTAENALLMGISPPKPSHKTRYVNSGGSAGDS